MKFLTIEDAVGKTPLVALQRIAATENAARGNIVLGKLEGNNPAGSVKDRPALAMIPVAFSPDDLAAVVRFYHPQVEEDTVRLLVEHYGQPLPLELVCSLPWVQQAADSREGRLRQNSAPVSRLCGSSPG